MRKPGCPPLAFWRAWLSLSARLFMRILICLCVAWSLFACLLPLFAPPPAPPALASGLDRLPPGQDE